MARQSQIEDLLLTKSLEQAAPRVPLQAESPANWIRAIRSYIRMSQTELSKRAGITQPHLALIENGKVDPQFGTLQKLFSAMSFQLSIDPRSEKSINDVLRGRARMVALRRLKQTMGTMALEKQSPEAEKFRALLEKQTDELLADKRARLWAGDDD